MFLHSCLCIAKSKYRKQLAIFYQFKLKTNKSALYRIQNNDVALGLGTYPQIARHRLWGPVLLL